jgi:hypothetical protein
VRRAVSILRFTLPFLGAFLFGVIPGAEIVHALYERSRSYAGNGPPAVLFVLSCFGSFLGLYVYHLICRRELNALDIRYSSVVAVVCWIMMAIYMLVKYAIPAGV